MSRRVKRPSEVKLYLVRSRMCRVLAMFLDVSQTTPGPLYLYRLVKLR